MLAIRQLLRSCNNVLSALPIAIFLRRKLFLYGGLVVIRAIQVSKKRMVHQGQRLKSVGRKLEELGEDRTARWSRELLLRCHMRSVEFHMSGVIYRGPVYAVYQSLINGDHLVFKCNWIGVSHIESIRATKQQDYCGSCAFRLSGCTGPVKLQNGDYYFGFDGGYGVLFLGSPRLREEFLGEQETPREFAYF
ncbi:MAG: hypothetical protein JWN18_563 [Parcubacteria group bacterium]|nr:hypothetical protein [Parcubacteria group bacterium]